MDEPDVRELRLHVEMAGVRLDLGVAKARFEKNKPVELIDYIPSQPLEEQEEDDALQYYLEHARRGAQGTNRPHA
jgi:hypothetical protein